MGEEIIANTDGWLYDIMGVCATTIGAIGVAVIVWGVLRAVFKLLRLEAASVSGYPVKKMREALRSHLGYYLLLGLEFLVAADIIETLRAPTLEHLAVLGGIVVIRTIISVSLNWELGHADDSAEA